MFEQGNTPFTMPVMPATGGYGNDGAWGDKLCPMIAEISKFLPLCRFQ